MLARKIPLRPTGSRPSRTERKRTTPSFLSPPEPYTEPVFEHRRDDQRPSPDRNRPVFQTDGGTDHSPLRGPSSKRNVTRPSFRCSKSSGTDEPSFLRSLVSLRWKNATGRGRINPDGPDPPTELRSSSTVCSSTREMGPILAPVNDRDTSKPETPSTYSFLRTRTTERPTVLRKNRRSEVTIPAELIRLVKFRWIYRNVVPKERKN